MGSIDKQRCSDSSALKDAKGSGTVSNIVDSVVEHDPGGPQQPIHVEAVNRRMDTVRVQVSEGCLAHPCSGILACGQMRT
jgi:hypothetical protein